MANIHSPQFGDAVIEGESGRNRSSLFTALDHRHISPLGPLWPFQKTSVTLSATSLSGGDPIYGGAAGA